MGFSAEMPILIPVTWVGKTSWYCGTKNCLSITKIGVYIGGPAVYNVCEDISMGYLTSQ